MRVADLRQVAESFGVGLEPNAKKESILVELEENGVTWDQYTKFKEAAENTPQEEPESPREQRSQILAEAHERFSNSQQLLKMVGKNASFEVLGFKFSQSHPFNFMSAKEAQDIIDFYPDKFRMASPREAEEFYK